MNHGCGEGLYLSENRTGNKEVYQLVIHPLIPFEVRHSTKTLERERQLVRNAGKIVVVANYLCSREFKVIMRCSYKTSPAVRSVYLLSTSTGLF